MEGWGGEEKRGEWRDGEEGKGGEESGKGRKKKKVLELVLRKQVGSINANS